jgi:UDP-glucose 4-epimerase
MKMTSLVTGGAGFIGSHVASRCLEMGHDVVVLDDLSGGFADQAPEGARLVTGSVEDDALVRSLFEEYRFDYVYHLAACAAVGLSQFIRQFNYRNNLVGSMTLVNAGVRCFVFASSISVYGRNQVPMTEDLVPLPEDPYGIAKYAVDRDLKAAHEIFGLNSVVFRPHNVYGEHQNLGDPYRNVIGIFMKRIMSGKPLPVFGDGEQTRAFTYVDDVARAIAESVTVPAECNEVSNMGAEAPYTVNQLARVDCEAFGVPVNIEYLAPRNEVAHVFATHEKVGRLPGANAKVGMAEGVGRMADWARKAGVRTARPFDAIEARQDLPSSWA